MPLSAESQDTEPAAEILPQAGALDAIPESPGIYRFYGLN